MVQRRDYRKKNGFRVTHVFSVWPSVLTVDRAVDSSRGWRHNSSSGSAVRFHVRPLRYDRPVERHVHVRKLFWNLPHSVLSVAEA